MNEKDAYPQILSKSKAYIIQRIDRDETTLKFIRNAIEHFNRESVSSPDSHDIIYRDNQNPTLFCNLGSATREEPIWPVTIQVRFHSLFCEIESMNKLNFIFCSGAWKTDHHGRAREKTCNNERR